MNKVLVITILSIITSFQILGQERKMNFGLNLNPKFILGGHYEGIILFNFSRRVKSKFSLGYTNAGDHSFFRNRCLIVDHITKRKEIGWFLKLNADYTYMKSDLLDLYYGGGLFYSRLRTSGILDNNIELNNSGDIFGPGFRLGARTKKIKPLLLDVGVELYFYGKDKYQLEPFCKGGIPGIGEANQGDYLFSGFIHVLF